MQMLFLLEMVIVLMMMMAMVVMTMVVMTMVVMMMAGNKRSKTMGDILLRDSVGAMVVHSKQESSHSSDRAGLFSSLSLTINTMIVMMNNINMMIVMVKMVVVMMKMMVVVMVMMMGIKISVGHLAPNQHFLYLLLH